SGSRRRHTSCLSDWSSDVCSSDLPAPGRPIAGDGGKNGRGRDKANKITHEGAFHNSVVNFLFSVFDCQAVNLSRVWGATLKGRQIGRASCRERRSASVRGARERNV